MQKKRLLYIGNKLAAKNNTISTIDTLSQKLRLEGFEVITKSSKINKLLRLLDMLFAVHKNRKYIDLVLIDTYSTQNFWYAISVAWLCRFYKLEYIPILHGGNLPTRLKSNQNTCKKYFGNAFTNVAPSNYLKNAFEQVGYDNIELIPNSIEIENYPFLKRTIKAPKLLWVRSFSEIYNPKLAISIFGKLKKKYPDAELCMVGPEKDGSLAECKMYAENLQVDVRFTGLLSKKDWIQLSKNYNIFINTTNFDNMPVSIIEAMALGLPVISTNVGGISKLIVDNQNGFLVKPNNESEFIDAIERILSLDSTIDSLTQNARNKAETFDWKSVKKLWLLLLER